MFEGLAETDICVMERCVFTNERNVYCVVQVVLAVRKVNPVPPHSTSLLNAWGRLWNGGEVEELAECFEEFLFLEKEGNVVCGGYVVYCNDLFSLHLAHVCDLVDCRVL